jgi:hypothetical protein
MDVSDSGSFRFINATAKIKDAEQYQVEDGVIRVLHWPFSETSYEGYLIPYQSLDIRINSSQTLCSISLERT